jgi:hypothetical protein
VRRQQTVEWRQQRREEPEQWREVREEQQRRDEVYEWRRLAEMQLRLQRHEFDHRRRWDELERQLR